MKSNFEQGIKDSLEGFELPYNAAAWSQLSAKLDTITPTATPKGSNGIWFAAAGVILVGIIGSVIYYSNSEKETNLTTTNTSKVEVTEDHKIKPEIESNELPSSSNDVKNVEAQQNIVSEPKPIINPFSSNSNVGNGWGNAAGNTSVGKTTDSSDEKNKDKGNKVDLATNSSKADSAPIIPLVKDICQGDKFEIKNENSFDLIVVSPTDDEYKITPNSSINIIANQTGKYSIRKRMSRSELTSFYVGTKPRIDFTIDEQIQYEDGVPAIPLETYSEASNFVWTFDGKNKQTGNTATASFYKKGTHTILLTAEGGRGCKSEIAKTVEIAEDYNLLAPTAFIPDNSDPRKNRFIPFALTLRNTGFTFVVMDPKNGNIIYQSSSTEGWDGYNRVTGEMVPSNSTYIWKVTLTNPEKGEKAEYQGTVVKL